MSRDPTTSHDEATMTRLDFQNGGRFPLTVLVSQASEAPIHGDTLPAVAVPPIEARDPRDAAFWADRLPVYGDNKIVGSIRVGDGPGCALPGKPDDYEPWMINGYAAGWQPKKKG
jgi:hypothetical protein